MGREFADIRTYHFDPEKATLLSPKKKRVVIEGIDGSSITMELSSFIHGAKPPNAIAKHCFVHTLSHAQRTEKRIDEERTLDPP
ncbi:unnamed protein product [Cylicocyclus nassatus]|uniref:Uncharacterized protein n=1 Tax=Cylicocyclus nassatus TaxID=53992 RepID=A0AA36DKT8_CYLNA|nr:unnamed protein product [Cylicocyclus nassatus]